MKKFLILLCTTNLVFGALPPFYQSSREIEAILQDPYLAKYSAEEVLSITKVDSGYKIKLTKHHLFAEIVILPATKIGPIEFTVSFHEIE